MAADCTWAAADLGLPYIDLEDPETLRRALDEDIEPGELHPPNAELGSSKQAE